MSSISSSKEIFDSAAPIYQAELSRAGYNHKLEFTEVEEPKRKRKRKIVWFNPPYCMSLKTNVGQKFLRLLDKHFPKGCALYLLIHRSKVKLSYRCVPNMGDQINKHNSNILRSKPKELKCNCRDQAECPLPGNGKCRTDKVIYRATVEANNQVETYVGLTAGELKTRYQQHKSDFNNTSDKNATTLSTHIWNLKDHNTPYDVKFEIVGRAAPYSAVTGRCNLCTLEKYEILFNQEKATLNSRNELFSACRHK